jgi:hypothetical protein
MREEHRLAAFKNTRLTRVPLPKTDEVTRDGENSIMSASKFVIFIKLYY